MIYLWTIIISVSSFVFSYHTQALLSAVMGLGFRV